MLTCQWRESLGKSVPCTDRISLTRRESWAVQFFRPYPPLFEPMYVNGLR